MLRSWATWATAQVLDHCNSAKMESILNANVHNDAIVESAT
jgi:hypothetical protein